MPANPQTDLLILGVYPTSDGYPNVKYRLQDLQALPEFNCTQLHVSIWKHNISHKSVLRSLLAASRLVTGHLLILVRFIAQRQRTLVYVPYPGVFVCALLACLPTKLRPQRLILDAFISLYDTVVCDRQLLKAHTLLAKLLFKVERYAYQHCSAVVVDTPQNAAYLSALFKLPQALFTAIPLSTYEASLKLPAYQAAPQDTLKILFVGTLIPLHGIDVIVNAIRLLAAESQLQFKIIGNGQLAAQVRELQQQFPDRLTWIDTWISQEQLVEEIAEADICLGVFGTSAKTQRVCPLKLYAYAAAGRSIITANTEWVNAQAAASAFMTVTPGSATELANAILHLSRSSAQRVAYASASRAFYENYLTNCQAVQQLKQLLLDETH